MAACAQIEQLLQSNIDGELTKRERAAVEHHVNHCTHCAELLARQEECAYYVQRALAPSRFHGDMTASVLAHLPEMDSQIRRRKRAWIQRTDHWFWPALSTAGPAMAVALLVVVAMSLYIIWPPEMEITGEVIGMVTSESGKAHRSHATSTETSKVELKGLVHGNERFETFDDSRMMLSLAGDTSLKLDENTRIVVQNTRKVAVEKGRVWLHVGKDGRHFRVLTPEGAVMVFGTTFDVNVEYGSTTVTVDEGEVQVENLSDFTSLKPGDQVRLADEVTQLTPTQVHSRDVMAWSLQVQPDPSAEQLYLEKIRGLGMRTVQAEMVFIIDNASVQDITSIAFEWSPDPHGAGHSGYDVYVSDDRGEALFKGRLEASLFADKNRTNVELQVPGNDTLSGVRMLQIKIVPDMSTGSIETAFKQVVGIRAPSEVGL